MYIIDSNSISPQIIDDIFSDKLIEHDGNKYFAIESSVKDFIPRAALRRMGKGIRFGIGSGLALLKRHQDIGGIIIATTSNGLGDCILFLNQIKEYDEGTLTPTNFVQSTPNSISGQLALLSNNPCYNTTHVQFGNAFENALIDAQMLLLDPGINYVLLGDVEEISSYNYRLDQKRDKFKAEPLSSSKLIHSQTKGTVSGEGSSMFILAKSKENAQALIKDSLSLFDKDIEKIKKGCLAFLEKNALKPQDIDAVLLGYNGNIDENGYYDQVASLFSNSISISFKQLCGEYSTSSSFAMYFGSQILVRKHVPKSAILNGDFTKVDRLLIYNSYQNDSHNFIILERP